MEGSRGRLAIVWRGLVGAAVGACVVLAFPVRAAASEVTVLSAIDSVGVRVNTLIGNVSALAGVVASVKAGVDDLEDQLTEEQQRASSRAAKLYEKLDNLRDQLTEEQQRASSRASIIYDKFAENLAELVEEKQRASTRAANLYDKLAAQAAAVADMEAQAELERARASSRAQGIYDRLAGVRADVAAGRVATAAEAAQVMAVVQASQREMSELVVAQVGLVQSRLTEIQDSGLTVGAGLAGISDWLEGMIGVSSICDPDPIDWDDLMSIEVQPIPVGVDQCSPVQKGRIEEARHRQAEAKGRAQDSAKRAAEALKAHGDAVDMKERLDEVKRAIEAAGEAAKAESDETQRILEGIAEGLGDGTGGSGTGTNPDIPGFGGATGGKLRAWGEIPLCLSPAVSSTCTGPSLTFPAVAGADAWTWYPAKGVCTLDLGPLRLIVGAVLIIGSAWLGARWILASVGIATPGEGTG